MVERTYYPPKAVEPLPKVAARKSPLHGYTMNDLDRVARIAASWSNSRACGVSDRYEIAWSAAAEHLCVSPEPPNERALIWVAKNAIDRMVRDIWHGYGVYPDGGAATGSQFHRFWTQPTSPWEDRVVDGMAMTQIWPSLTEAQRVALMALAVYETYENAAKSLSLTYAQFMCRITRGRARFRQLWHEGEKPSGQWGRDERARRGDKTAMQSRYDATRKPSRKRSAS